MDERGPSEDEDMRVHLLQDSTKPEETKCITALFLRSILVACCGSFMQGCSIGYTSPVESEMKSDLNLTTSQFSLFGSMLTVGALIGSLLSGKVTDWIGRRYSMGLSDLLSIVGWALIALSQGVLSLYLGRLLLGSALGLFSYVISIYIAEIAPKNLRGAAVLTCTMANFSAVSFTLLVGLAVNWRVLALIASIPSITQIIGLFFVPESPRWLLKVGLHEEYKTALQQLRGYNVDISEEATEIKELNEALEKTPDVNFIHLFQSRYAYALTIVLGLMALSSGSGSMAITFYASHIFEAAGLSATIGSIGLAIMQVAGVFFGLLLTDRVGRRFLLMISACGMSIGCMLISLSFLLEDGSLLTKISPYLAFFGVVLFFATYAVGMGGVPHLLMSELFPMNAKGAAGSIANMVSWSTSWVVTYTFTFMLEWTTSGTFLVFACINACSVVFVVKLVVETKKWSLEEIQTSTTTQSVNDRE